MLLAVASPPLLAAYESDCEGCQGVAGELVAGGAKL